MQVGISDEERDALVAFLRERIDSERLPRSSRLPLKRFLSKLAPATTEVPAELRGSMGSRVPEDNGP
jgi:hypothetical protein